MFKPFAMKSETTALLANPKPADPPTLSRPQVKARTARSVIGVLGAKGGVGATTTAINLAACFARSFENQSVTLLDADLQQPDVAVLSSVESKYSLLDLLDRGEEVDDAIVSACTTSLSASRTNCRLISPPADGSAALQTNLTDLTSCLQRMKDACDFWVLDLPKHLDRHLVTLMDNCDFVVLVFEPTIPSIHAATRWARIFRELGYGDRKIVWVANRSGSKVKIVEKELERLAPFSEIQRIPNAFELAQSSSVRGEPAVISSPRAPYSVAVAQLVERLSKRGSGNV